MDAKAGLKAVRLVVGMMTVALFLSIVLSPAIGPVEARTTSPDCSTIDYNGDGTTNDPYRVSNISQLQCMSDKSTTTTLGDDFTQVSDIDASGTSEWNNGSGFDPMGFSGSFDYMPYNGTFDGQGYNITNLTIDRGGKSRVGIFGGVGSEGKITNVSVVDANINGDRNAGVLAGVNSGNISESYAMGVLNGSSNVGGIVGYNSGSVTKSNASVLVRGINNRVGGLVGLHYGTVSESYATGSVEGSGSVGGLVGANDAYRGTIMNSYATGEVDGFNSVGGLVGFNLGTVDRSNATSSVNGTEQIGGLVGNNGNSDGGTIMNSYATGIVNGTKFVGGLTGQNNGNIRDSYAVGLVNGFDDVGGLVGLNDSTVRDSYWDIQTTEQSSSDGGIGLTTEQMIGEAASDNMTGLNFLSTWKKVTSPDSYPILTWQQEDDRNIPPTSSFTYSPSDPKVGEIVNFDASNSYDFDGNINSYNWIFNDGTTAAGEAISHSYNSSGNYTVELTVTDDDGVEDTTTAKVAVSPMESTPKADINVTKGDDSFSIKIKDTGNLDTLQLFAPNGTRSTEGVNVIQEGTTIRISDSPDINTTVIDPADLGSSVQANDILGDTLAVGNYEITEETFECVTFHDGYTQFNGTVINGDQNHPCHTPVLAHFDVLGELTIDKSIDFGSFEDGKPVPITYQEGTYELVGTVDNSSAVVKTVTVEPDDAFFDVNITDTNSTVTEGDALEVTANVTNTRGQPDTQNVVLKDTGFGDVERDNLSLTLDAGESNSSVTLSWETEVGVNGTGNVTVSSENDSDTREITIEEETTLSPVNGFDSPPQDLNEDGLHEDITGDGEFNLGDVIALYDNYEDDPVLNNNPELFNFNGQENPEDVTLGDVIALYDEL